MLSGKLYCENWRGGWMCFWGEPGQAHLLRMAWVQLAPWLSIRPRAGASGVSPSMVPTQVWEDREDGLGCSKKEPGTLMS